MADPALIAGPHAEPFRSAALAAGLFVVDLSFAAADPAIRQGEAANIVQLRTDEAARFFAATMDLVLRSNDIGTLVLAGDAPDGFWDRLAIFADLHGYDLLRDPTDIRAENPASRGWQADRKQAALLPDLAARIDPRHAALVLIDVQNDFCHPEGAAGRSGEAMTMIADALARIRHLLAAARAAGLTIVHVGAEYGLLYRAVGSPYRYPSSSALEPAVWTASAARLGNDRFPADTAEICLPQSWGRRFVDGIAPLPGEIVVTKHRFSAMIDTGLAQTLRRHRVRTAILAGVTTNCCVESTARDMAMHDFYVVIAEDGVAVKDRLRHLHDASLESMRLYFGQVVPSEDIMAVWAASHAAP